MHKLLFIIHDLIHFQFTQTPYLREIDEIEKSVADLEAAAYKLDAYSQKLEQKFNSLVTNKK